MRQEIRCAAKSETSERCFMETIGAIISSYRKKAHISQTELVGRLQEEGIDVSQKSVSAWETGRNEVSARIFLHICRILEIPDCLEEYFGSNPKDPLAMLNDEGKQKALSYIDMLAHPVSYIKETNVIIFSIPIITRPSKCPPGTQRARILPLPSAETVWNRHFMIMTWYMCTSRKHWTTGKSGSSR